MDHALGAGHCLVGPGGALVHLEIDVGLLRCVEVEALEPARAFPVRAGVAWVDLDAAHHQLAQRSGLGQDAGLPGVGLEGLALDDAKGGALLQ